MRIIVEVADGAVINVWSDVYEDVDVSVMDHDCASVDSDAEEQRDILQDEVESELLYGIL